jgi:hypothetical protein
LQLVGDDVFVTNTARPQHAETESVCAPSRCESHGVDLIEAMMFGKPIVTCNAGGIAEVVDTGRNALLTPPQDAAALAASLRRLVEDPALRRRMGACARMTYERRFHAGAVAREMEAFLERVISRGRGCDTTSDVRTRFAELVREVLALDPAAASDLAGELLSLPTASQLSAPGPAQWPSHPA